MSNLHIAGTHVQSFLKAALKCETKVLCYSKHKMYDVIVWNRNRVLVK